MLKKKSFLAIIMATMMLGGTIAGCGSTTGKSAEATKKLTVWSHLKPEEYEGLKELAQKWSTDNGIEVEVVDDKSDMQSYIEAANSSKGPDLMFGIPHDNLGTFQKANLLSEVPAGMINKDDYTSNKIVDAVTIGGKQYALPLATETACLYYNKDLVKDAPKTMEELIEIAKTKGFVYDVNNFYFSYGFLAANGGYVYKNNNGTLDPTDIGLGNSGAIKGYQFIQDLVLKDKLMPPDLTGDIAQGTFADGKTAFYISGPWDIAGLKGKVNFGIAPMPTLGGNPIKTFMGVQTGFVSSKSKNQEDSWKLLKYLSDNNSDLMLDKGNRIPVLKSFIEGDKFKKNEFMAAFGEQVKNAEPMPNIPEVQAMWTPEANNLLLLTSGQQTPEQCAQNVVAQVKEGIAQQ